MPESAAARAGATLMPTPPIVTICPPCFSASMVAASSRGRTSASTRSMPTAAATAVALPRGVARDENGLHIDGTQTCNGGHCTHLVDVGEGEQTEKTRCVGDVGEPGNGPAIGGKAVRLRPGAPRNGRGRSMQPGVGNLGEPVACTTIEQLDAKTQPTSLDAGRQVCAGTVPHCLSNPTPVQADSGRAGKRSIGAPTHRRSRSRSPSSVSFKSKIARGCLG